MDKTKSSAEIMSIDELLNIDLSVPNYQKP